MSTSEVGWIKKYIEKKAYWVHDAHHKRPHALLTSGKHSAGFFNSELVMEDPLLLEAGCAHLCTLLMQEGFNIHEIDRVVGPAMGAITLAHELARRVGRKRGHTCLRAYTEKQINGEEGQMVFKKTSIARGERILLTEDVLTTGGSVGRCARAVTDAGGITMPFVVVLVNRSDQREVDGKKIIALINQPMPTWEERECPLCVVGSKAIRPKESENWKLLNASYD